MLLMLFDIIITMLRAHDAAIHTLAFIRYATPLIRLFADDAAIAAATCHRRLLQLLPHSFMPLPLLSRDATWVLPHAADTPLRHNIDYYDDTPCHIIAAYCYATCSPILPARAAAAPLAAIFTTWLCRYCHTPLSPFSMLMILFLWGATPHWYFPSRSAHDFRRSCHCISFAELHTVITVYITRIFFVCV